MGRINTASSLRSAIEPYSVILSDIDGVLSNSTLNIEAIKTLIEMADMGKDIYLLSNNAFNLPDEIAQKFQKAGFDIKEDNIITSGMAFSVVFKENHLQNKKILGVGTEATFEYIRRAGGKPLKDDNAWREAKAVVIGYPAKSGDYKNGLNAAFNAALRNEVPVIIGTDEIFSFSHDEVGLGSASMGLIFEKYIGHKPIRTGKPFTPIYDVAFNMIGNVPKKYILAIGDTVFYDVLGASNAGIDSLLVLSGLQNILTPGPLLKLYIKKTGTYPTYIMDSLASGLDGFVRRVRK